MKVYRCSICGFSSDSEPENVPRVYPGEPDEVFYNDEEKSEFPDVAESWCCPKCGVPGASK